jgi:hypothetical protein
MMRLVLIAVLLFVAVDTSAQTGLDGQFPQQPEPITTMPYGGYAHDNSLKTKERTEEGSPSLTPGAPSWIPRPILFAGPSFVGNGYQEFAESLGGGLILNAKRLISNAEGRYMNARKTDDGTVNNRKGHERYLQGRLFYKVRPNLYFGGGAQWSETSTTNYTKQGWRPTFGGGGDHFAADWSCRWQVLYIMPGTDRQNAVQSRNFSSGFRRSDSSTLSADAWHLRISHDCY